MAVGWVLLGPDGAEYRVTAITQNAGQLVEGNLVKIGGVPVGTVESIELGDRSEARITMRIDEDRFTPLHEGTKATIRSTSLSSVAGRSVALQPGPNSAPEIDGGGTIPPEDVEPIVDLDQVINTLDASTRAALQDLVHGGADALGGRGKATRRALESLSPALQEATATAGELTRDQRAFEQALVTSAGVMDAVAGEREALERGLANGATAVGALARERKALDATLRRAPDTLRASNSMLVELRAALDDLRPALREGRPVADRLAPVMRDVRPVAQQARPVARDLRALLPDVSGLLDRMPKTEAIATPALGSARTALDDADPIVAAARVYTPDLVAGLLNGFGGTTGGYYDANGHYVRIGLAGNLMSLQGLGSILDLPAPDNGILSWRRDRTARCPGSATQDRGDGTNAWHPPEAQCDPEHDLK